MRLVQGALLAITANDDNGYLNPRSANCLCKEQLGLEEAKEKPRNLMARESRKIMSVRMSSEWEGCLDRDLSREAPANDVER